MKIGQKGTARNGQTGEIVEVYTNAVLFQSTTGARFTLLNAEFTPAGSTDEQRQKIARRAKALFEHVGPNDGFHFCAHRRLGRISHVTFKRVPPFGGDPQPEVAPPSVFAYAFEGGAA